MRSLFVILVLAVCAGATAGAIVLQVFLSKKENKWLGLIMPIISFGISVLAMLGALFFTAFTGTQTLTVNGEIVETVVRHSGDMSAIIVSSIYVFLFWNIPTAILLAIYGGCRSKRNKQRALEKMSVQDLE